MALAEGVNNWGQHCPKAIISRGCQAARPRRAIPASQGGVRIRLLGFSFVFRLEFGLGFCFSVCYMRHLRQL